VSAIVWNVGIPRWLGPWGRIAWARKGVCPLGTWRRVIGRLYVSPRKPWMELLEAMEG